MNITLVQVLDSNRAENRSVSTVFYHSGCEKVLKFNAILRSIIRLDGSEAPLSPGEKASMEAYPEDGHDYIA